MAQAKQPETRSMAIAETFSFDSDQRSDRAEFTGRRAGAEAAARDWLETQARVAGFWRDMVADADGDLSLVRALEAHCEFLREACGRD